MVSGVELKVVGEIKPPDFRDPVKMLRNIADEIESGDYGEVSAIAVVRLGDEGLQIHAGGVRSEVSRVATMLMAAAGRLAERVAETGE